ncbi:MAG: peptide-methionine (S)-S-oxide reductase MsrA [Candidatus Thermoplasmatota archaeon]|nr:peptide-methionine (S)-S-oxide reductase MsrA [Candidatus Thermoplasmatota archaeon]
MTQKATFGAGCFWHVEEAFRHIKGVVRTTVGYSGGNMKNPTYRDVCSGRTHHAEVVQVEFDPSVVSYDELLEIFWRDHDPTTLNRQGPDVGEQYRSVIFHHDDAQKAAAIDSRERLQKTDRFKNRKIVTEIMPAQEFYPAEEYHQRYFERRGMHACRAC